MDGGWTEFGRRVDGARTESGPSLDGVDGNWTEWTESGQKVDGDRAERVDGGWAECDVTLCNRTRARGRAVG